MFAQGYGLEGEPTTAGAERPPRPEPEAAWAITADLLESIADAYLALDEQWRCIYLNRQAEALLGSLRDDVLGASLWQVFPQAVGSRTYHACLRAAHERRVVEVEDYFPGANRWYAVCASPSAAGLVVSLRDITEHRRVQEERDRLLASGQAAREAAEEAIRARDDILVGVAHDLSAPLTIILVNAQVLRGTAVTLDEAVRQRMVERLQVIEISARRMARTTEELIDAARLHAGQPLALNRRRVDLAALARQVAEELQHASDEHRINVEADPAEVVGFWDARRLERVLGNLLSNALKYSPGGREIRVTLAQETDAAGQAWAVLTVTDHGLGIPEADLPFIFDHFRRGSNVEGRIPGSGLGLAGVRRIVEDHGGSVSVASRLGEGSTFTVRIPRQPLG